MWEDLRVAVRTSRRHPGFTTLAVVTLALGIAANTAIFSVVRGVLLRPLPYPDPARIVAVWTSTPTTMRSSHSAGDFIDIERENQSFDAIAGYRPDLFAVTTDGTQALQFEGAHVTAPFFEVFGMPALAGRAFTQAMDAKAGGRLVVLGEPAWRQIFPAGREAVGAAIRINGQSHVVVGVLVSTLVTRANSFSASNAGTPARSS